MPNVVKLREIGNQILVLFDDGSNLTAYPSQGGLWYVGSGSGGEDSGGTGSGAGATDPGVGGYVVGAGHPVIFPTLTTNISDTFADHVARGSVNPGTDYTASFGSQVYSVSDGIVTVLEPTIGGSGGRMIHIDNNDGYGADYLHLSSIDIALGTAVVQGQPIAHSGASGYGSEHYYGPHLHISYRPNHDHGWANDGNIDFDAFLRAH